MKQAIINLTVCAVTVLVSVVAADACYDYTPPNYTPAERAAMDWGHEHLGDRVTVICEGSACMVWATYYSGRSSHTSPPILLTCSSACVPDFARSVALPRVAP